MGNEDRYFELVRQASENVSKYIKKRIEQNGDDRWGEYEATWKALLFHELILIDEKVKNYLSMENPADTEDQDTKRKKFDVWIQDSEININYVMEVKLTYFEEPKKESWIKMRNKESGVYADLIKINTYLKSDHDIKGISIAANLTKGIDVNQIVDNVDDDTKKLLRGDLRLMICSDGKCAYVTANKESK